MNTRISPLSQTSPSHAERRHEPRRNPRPDLRGHHDPPFCMGYLMTPHEWIVVQRRRQERRDAGWAFLIIACLLVVLIVGAWLAVAWLEGRL